MHFILGIKVTYLQKSVDLTNPETEKFQILKKCKDPQLLDTEKEDHIILY